MKAKLIEGRLVYAKKVIREGNRMIANPTDEILAKLGYKEVVETDAPEAEEGFFFAPHWEYNGDAIVRVWEKVELSNDMPDELPNA